MLMSPQLNSKAARSGFVWLRSKGFDLKSSLLPAFFLAFFVGFVFFAVKAFLFALPIAEGIKIYLKEAQRSQRKTLI
jgi:lipopolysaccharide export LptBFGC system permease protein LptF